jgi:aryl-alcohol dehydrogenase-like predicted oxidoreductase
LLHTGDDIVPIPGTKRRQYLEEKLGAADVTLTRDDMAALDRALSPERISGPRYAPAQQAQVDR